MLPYDYARCNPEIVDVQCRGCQRWAQHQDQTWGDRTPMVMVIDKDSIHCEYIPIDREDGK